MASPSVSMNGSNFKATESPRNVGPLHDSTDLNGGGNRNERGSDLAISGNGGTNSATGGLGLCHSDGGLGEAENLDHGSRGLAPANEKYTQAKTAYFYRDGAFNQDAIRVAIHPNRYRSLDTLLTDLTHRMPDLSYGVRALFTPKGRDRLSSIEQLDNDGRYVCSQNERKARGIHLEQIRPTPCWRIGKPPSGRRAYNNSLRLTSTAPEMRPIARLRPLHRPAPPLSDPGSVNDSSPTGVAASGPSVASIRRAETKRIYVRRNGEMFHRHVILLNKRNVRSFEQLLDDLSGVFQMPVRKLYTMEGNCVEGVSGVFNGPDNFVAAGYEKFRPLLAWSNSPDEPQQPRKAVNGSGPVQKRIRETRTKQNKSKGVWRVWVTTRDDESDCGTTAQVSLVVYGRAGVSQPLPLNLPLAHDDTLVDTFQPGQVDEFEISVGNISEIQKIRIGHDNSGSAPGWLLGEVRMRDVHSDEELVFRFDRWLARDRDDGEICRELPASRPGAKIAPVTKYRVAVTTGDCWNAGTDANVVCTIYGDNGDTGSRHLFKPVYSKPRLFVKGETDVFEIEAVQLGRLRRIVIGHDGVGPGYGWFLDKIVVREEGPPGNDTSRRGGGMSEEVVFLCSRWLDEGEDDGKTVRELKALEDYMHDAMEKEMWEYEKWKFDPDNQLILFSRATEQPLRVRGDGAVDALGEVQNPESVFVIVPKKGAGGPSGSPANVRILRSLAHPRLYLTLDRGEVSAPARASLYSEFKVRVQPDRMVVLESVKFSQQHIHVNKSGAPADPRGPAGLLGKLFAPYCKGVFRDLGIIMFNTSLTQALALDHENKLRATGKRNRMAQFRVHKVETGVRTFESVIFPEQYLRIKDGHCDCLGTGDADCQFRVERFRDKGFVALQSVASRGIFLGMTQDGQVRPTIDTGEKNVRFFPEVVKFGTSRRQLAVLPPLEDQEDLPHPPATTRQEKHEPQPRRRPQPKAAAPVIAKPSPRAAKPAVVASAEDEDKEYYTENDWKLWVYSAQTAQQGEIIIYVYGDEGNSGPIMLGQAESDLGLFLAGNTDEFKINVPQIGNIFKIRMEISPLDIVVSPFWSLQQVVLENAVTEDRLIFDFNGRMFSRELEDRQLAREQSVVPPTATATNPDAQPLPIGYYKVQLTTGDMPAAETTSQVFVCLFGEFGDSGRRTVFTTDVLRPCFQRAQTDEVMIECVHLGILKRCLIGHSGTEPGQGWFCERAVVTDPLSGEETVFTCNSWLDAGIEDGKIERLLKPDNSSPSAVTADDGSYEEELERLVDKEDDEMTQKIYEDAKVLIEDITEQAARHVEEYHAKGDQNPAAVAETGAEGEPPTDQNPAAVAETGAEGEPPTDQNPAAVAENGAEGNPPTDQAQNGGEQKNIPGEPETK